MSREELTMSTTCGFPLRSFQESHEIARRLLRGCKGSGKHKQVHQQQTFEDPPEVFWEICEIPKYQ